MAKMAASFRVPPIFGISVNIWDDDLNDFHLVGVTQLPDAQGLGTSWNIDIT